MVSGEEYQAYLDKLNDEAYASAISKPGDTKTVTTENPWPPRELEMFKKIVLGHPNVAHQTDEPFIPVSLAYDEKKLPSTETFKTLIEAPSSTRVDYIIVPQWNQHRYYTSMVTYLQGITHDKTGMVVYRVALEESRVQYYCVGLEKKGLDRLIGFREQLVER